LNIEQGLTIFDLRSILEEDMMELVNWGIRVEE